MSDIFFIPPPGRRGIFHGDGIYLPNAAKFAVTGK